MKIGTLKNWCIEDRYYGNIVSGNIYNDERFKDGTYIHTSSIQEIIDEGDTLVVITRNNTYNLNIADKEI